MGAPTSGIATTAACRTGKDSWAASDAPRARAPQESVLVLAWGPGPFLASTKDVFEADVGGGKTLEMVAGPEPSPSWLANVGLLWGGSFFAERLKRIGMALPENRSFNLKFISVRRQGRREG